VRTRVAWLAVVVAVLVSSCSGGSRVGAPAPSPSPSSVTVAARPTTTVRHAAKVTPTPPNTVLVARATASSVLVFADPTTRLPFLTLPNPWLVNGDAADPVPQVFLVRQQRSDGWVQVLLPVRPNGSLGWVRSDALQLFADPYALDVSVSAHTIQVRDGASVVYQGPVAVGAPATPTPTGDYYVRVLLRSTDPTSVYGPFAYGLSAHSDALTTFAGGDAEVGVHGNNDASALGRSVTHGCVRMDNAEITALSGLLPLGTPVHIVA
jgi:lipoprotein-anchoring transpeptidase ErfK/SrfK